MWWMLFPRWIWFFSAQLMVILPDSRVRAIALPNITDSHAGICPNEMNPNMWVDAMSTCTRECETDEECDSFEKCCSNVCGSQSCVAARHMERPVPATSCQDFPCTQQGSECHTGHGQPACRCRDRCDSQPRFTCASDGMTYYNPCFMDAEACSKGTALTVVPCRFHLSWSPAGPQAPSLPSPERVSSAPVISARRVLEVGHTASFLCEARGWPKPEVTWEKQVPGAETVVLRPNQMRGNAAVTDAGQLVIHDAQAADSATYVCTARNALGSAHSSHVLSVVPKQGLVDEEAQPRNDTRLLGEKCLKPPDAEQCEEGGVSWYYDGQRNSCFARSQCDGNGSHFQTFAACMGACGAEVSAPCSLLSLQGPCKAYEPRWAYSSALKRCHSFVYGGCGGNENNFPSKEACEEACPLPGNQRCKPCKPRLRMANSFCGSDFVLLGSVREVAEKPSGMALLVVEEVLKDQTGLEVSGREVLEVTMPDVDWACPCPNVTAADGQLVVMGHVVNGVAVLRPDSYVGVASGRRLRKLREVILKNTCALLNEFPLVQ